MCGHLASYPNPPHNIHKLKEKSGEKSEDKTSK
jgi:hypothetical protein